MRDDIETGRIIRYGVAALAVLVVVAAAALALALSWDTGPTQGGARHPRPRIPGPVLESAPQSDLARYLARKHGLLEGYAWIDRDAGVARIPLDAAMRALAERDAARQGGKEQPP